MENMENKTLTRQELYELVWKTPMRRLACQFGLSDVGLAKNCRRHAIPTPKPGYWAKKRHGKIVRRIPLPPGDDALITLGSYTDTPVPKPPKPSLVSTFFDPELGRQAEIEAKGSIVVPDSLRSPHSLVERTRDGLVAASKDKGYHREPVLFPRCLGDLCCLDVRVGPLNINRAMRIMDALIKVLETRGYKVSVPSQRWEHGTPIERWGVASEFGFGNRLIGKITSQRKRSAKRSPSIRIYIRFPNGITCYRISCHWSCRDNTAGPFVQFGTAKSGLKTSFPRY